MCRWSPDGVKIATAGDDEKTTLWDVETMDELQYVQSTMKNRINQYWGIMTPLMNRR